MLGYLEVVEKHTAMDDKRGCATEMTSGGGMVVQLRVLAFVARLDVVK